ncbi:hypothetical protein CN602_19115 [Bacillus cereus]|jgi:hypothetical protein|uniref:Spermidine/putrescine ABC transporter ATP-binding protein n=1 Tax=Bacillus thuringiensis TaxID=1428 RepID=A0A9X7AQN5_BACTU|nr:hypothetical protein CN602_19115 [Bacillus cereus]PFT49422.1 hypothetical protein COK72_05915 [Bacillus thuringiensis]PFX71365.1 hypothetical protein COL39_23645 [Bacillus cereus]PQQ44177.1 hypothetical protein C6A34_27780 [Bacillus thuringiensis]
MECKAIDRNIGCLFLYLSRYLPGSKTPPQNSAEAKKLGGGPAARKRPIGEGSLYIEAGSGKILSHLY